MCPEQERECLVYHADQSRSYDRSPWFASRSLLGSSSQSLLWMVLQVRLQDSTLMRGHGKAKTVKSGLLPRVLPSELKAFQPIQQIVRIQMKKDCDGKTLVRSMSMSPSCIQVKNPIQHVQSARSSTCPRMTSSSTCSGSRLSSTLIERILKTLECIAQIVT